MFKRMWMVVMVLLLAIPLVQAVASEPTTPEPYSPEWLALNHAKVDNLISAHYEYQMQAAAQSFARGILARSLGESSPDSPVAANDVRMSGNTLTTDQNEFQIDINPTNNLFAIGGSNDGLTSGTGYYRTSDGGLTWFSADMPGIGASCCDPGVAYAFDGTAYFINLDTSPAVAHITKSTDNGVTWTKMTDAAADDRTNIVVDNGSASSFRGRVYITYSDLVTNPTNEIRLFYSSDGGATWSSSINVSNLHPTGGGYAQSSQPRVAKDGTLYVGFQYYSNGTNASAQNMIAKSTDGGNTFQPATVISAGPHLQGGLVIAGDARGYFCYDLSGSTFRHRSFPIIGIDPANPQNVYAAWAGGNLETTYTCGSLSGFHSDMLFSKSTDGGATWSAPLKINTDPQGKDQYYPWMSVDVSGTIWLGWHDRREDPNNLKHRWDMARSTDGGTTFSANLRVADVQSQPTFFIGDYAGLAASHGTILPMWWDSRVPTNSGGDPFTQVLHGR